MTADPSGLAAAIRDGALAGGADDAECFVRSLQSMRLEVQDGKVAGIRRVNEISAALRVLVEGRPGFSFATDPGPDVINGMIGDAVAAAALVEPSEDNRFSAATSLGDVPELFDARGQSLPLEEKVRLTVIQEEAARSRDRRITRVHRPSYSEQFRVTAIASGGQVWSYTDSVFSMGTQAIAGDGEISQSGYEWAVARRLSELDPAALGEAAAAEAAGLLGGKPPVTGTYRILLPPRAVIDTLGVLLPSFSADEMQKGRSRMAGRQGEKVFSSSLTLLDDGARAWGVGTVPFDDERVVPVARPLVDEGVVQGKLHTIKTAAREGEEPTGNAFRGDAASMPSASTTNLLIKPGPGPISAHLDGTVMQIINMMGMHTADRISGDFSVGASGYVLEDGERVRPFRNGTVSGNIFDLLGDVAAVGDDLVFYASTGAPSLLLGAAVVSGN